MNPFNWSWSEEELLYKKLQLIITVVFPPISAEKVDIARGCAPRQKNANNMRNKILLHKKVGAIANTEC